MIGPLNQYNAPGYFLNCSTQAADIIREVGKPNLKLMFDFYHIQIMEGDVTRRFVAMLPLVGRVQIASVPDRGTPDHGELDDTYVLPRIAARGWTPPIGAKNLPENKAVPNKSWLARYQQKMAYEVMIKKEAIGFISLGYSICEDYAVKKLHTRKFLVVSNAQKFTQSTLLYCTRYAHSCF